MASRSKHNLRLSEGIARFLERAVGAGQSEASIRSLTSALARLQRAVGSKREPDPFLHAITRTQMDDYCFGPDGIRRGVAAVTFNRYRSVLRTFFEYALMQHWIDQNPMVDIRSARPEARQSRLMLNAGELLALLDYCGNPVERIACALGMNTGLRANDLKRLTVFDVSLASGVIQTEIRKTHKLDVKPISVDLRMEIVRWLDAYADLMDLPSRSELDGDWLLVPTYRCPAPAERDRRIKIRPLGVIDAPHRLVQRPLARMGYPTRGEGFHTLRRSSARVFFEMLREADHGKDQALMIVQAFLNHANTIQTQAYLGLNEERAIRDSLLRDRPFLSTVRHTEQSRVQPDSGTRVASLGAGNRSAM